MKNTETPQKLSALFIVNYSLFTIHYSLSRVSGVSVIALQKVYLHSGQRGRKNRPLLKSNRRFVSADSAPGRGGRN